MRMARLAGTILKPHLKPGVTIDANNFMLFPDDVHDLDEDVEEHERAMMLALSRAAGG